MKSYLAFLLTAALLPAAQAQLFMDEPFTYPDGALTNVASGLWNYTSGSGGLLTLNVVGGRAFVRQNDAEGGHDDYNRIFGAGVDPATDNITRLYAGFLINFSDLPFSSGTNISGSYFAHFKSTAANEFYGRVGANMESGALRLALANEAWDAARSVEFPQDLQLGRDYQVVLRLDLATDQSTLWIDPLNETSTSITATDAFGFAGTINAFGLRQGTSGSGANLGAPGNLFLDNLRIGSSFQDVVAVPEPGTLTLAGAFAACLWFARRKQS